MAVDQNYREVIVKVAEEVTPGDKSDLQNKVRITNEESDPVPVSLYPTTPRITNLSLPTKNIEVDHTLLMDLKKIRIRNRGTGRLRFSYTDTQSGTLFYTIPVGEEYIDDGINLEAGSLHIQSNKDGDIVEIMEWSA